MARTSDPSAATKKAWETRARAAGGGTAVQQRGDFALSQQRIPRNAREAAKAVAESMAAHGLTDRFATQAGAEKDWLAGLEGRVHNTNPERRAIIEAAHQENMNNNPLFQEIVGTYEGGYGAVVFARNADVEKFGERMLAVTLIYDSVSPYAEEEYALRNETPKPGAGTASAYGGMASSLRHEFGHHAFSVLEYNAIHRPALEEISRALNLMRDVSKELTSFAGEAGSPAEAFAEALAIGTHPKYDPALFGEAARGYIATVIKHTRSGRGKAIKGG